MKIANALRLVPDLAAVCDRKALNDHLAALPDATLIALVEGMPKAAPKTKAKDAPAPVPDEVLQAVYAKITDEPQTSKALGVATDVEREALHQLLGAGAIRRDGKGAGTRYARAS